MRHLLMRHLLKIGLMMAGFGLTGCTVIICVPRSSCDRIVDIPPYQSANRNTFIFPRRPPIFEHEFQQPLATAVKPAVTAADTSQSYRRAANLISQSAAYLGPGDMVPGATAFYGLRAYNAAYARPGNNNAIQVRRARDQALLNINILKSGQIDIATLQNFCVSTDCFVTKWYDQSGHGNDITQTSPAHQPRLVLDGFRKFPTLQFDFNRSTYLSGSFSWVSGNDSWAGQVALLSVEPTRWYEPIFDYGTTSAQESLFALVRDSSSYEPSVSVYGTDLLSDIAADAPSSFTFWSDGSDVGGFDNGVEWEKPYRDSNITGKTFNLGGSPAQSGIWLTGSLGEVILYPNALSAAKAKKLEASERSYYGF